MQDTYLAMKNPRASRALSQALDPIRAHFDSAALSRQKVPKFSVWAPPLQKAGYGPNMYLIYLHTSV